MTYMHIVHYYFEEKNDVSSFISAPEAILEAAGGILTDIRGNHYTYGESVLFPNKLGVIATAKNTNHSEIIDKLPESIKQALDNN